MNKSDRRTFLRQSSLAALGTGSLLTIPTIGCSQPESFQDSIHIVGPKEGYTPHIGTMVSMLNWMRATILRPVMDLKVSELDYLVDDEANTIGAMLWHLASTERYYQIHTFEGRDWGDWDQKDTDDWGVASGLGDEARKGIKGNDLEFYLEKLNSVRENTLQELANRDDDWLMTIDENWFWGPTNNYCKWFHVCEHESNHNGQFKFIKSRLPGR